jgi:hypothetical protein
MVKLRIGRQATFRSWKIDVRKAGIEQSGKEHSNWESTQ